MAVLGLRFCATAFLQLRQAGATLHHGARASHHRGLSCCGAQAPDAQAQQLWLTGLVAPRHVGSPRPGLEPMSPALAGRFSTTAPPGKPLVCYFCFSFAAFNNFSLSLIFSNLNTMCLDVFLLEIGRASCRERV